ncbi:hypothetical protein [Kitasatospora sp. MAP5-34]|uniref:hypothetical protein n=1 Tax=Kitasatospora sp. MAP5-34 TaxID=3035102 RepID=UPI002473E3E5|nr:hypothetical protein [Kitasatospora sp. MAP5-34]MDH6579938.1 uncharacterized protein YegP (UPF0339 family) [Kitasatospora sp. MAP5-34]
MEQPRSQDDAWGGRSGGRCVAEKSASGLYAWRLKAPNGRIVAVSPDHFRTPEAAVRACLELRDEGAGHFARIIHQSEGIGWIWTVPGPHGRPLARSLRAYERHATCQNAFRRFVALLGAPQGRPEAGAAAVAGEPPVAPVPSGLGPTRPPAERTGGPSRPTEGW